MRKMIVLLMIIIGIGFIGIYRVTINEEHPLSLINLYPPSEFMKYESVDDDLQTYVYRDQKVIRALHELMITKTGRRLRNEDDFEAVAEFQYGYKGVSAKIDGEGRIVVPIRIIDLKERSTIDYIVWKTYQVINNDYYVDYISEPDEEILKLVKQIEFTKLE